MTPADLAKINALYSRYIRLTYLIPKPSASMRAEAYMVRQQLADLGLIVDSDAPKPPAAA